MSFAKQVRRVQVAYYSRELYDELHKVYGAVRVLYPSAKNFETQPAYREAMAKMMLVMSSFCADWELPEDKVILTDWFMCAYKLFMAALGDDSLLSGATVRGSRTRPSGDYNETAAAALLLSYKTQSVFEHVGPRCQPVNMFFLFAVFKTFDANGQRVESAMTKPALAAFTRTVNKLERYMYDRTDGHPCGKVRKAKKVRFEDVSDVTTKHKLPGPTEFEQWVTAKQKQGRDLHGTMSLTAERNLYDRDRNRETVEHEFEEAVKIAVSNAYPILLESCGVEMFDTDGYNYLDLLDARANLDKSQFQQRAMPMKRSQFLKLSKRTKESLYDYWGVPPSVSILIGLSVDVGHDYLHYMLQHRPDVVNRVFIHSLVIAVFLYLLEAFRVTFSSGGMRVFGDCDFTGLDYERLGLEFAKNDVVREIVRALDYEQYADFKGGMVGVVNPAMRDLAFLIRSTT